MAGKELNFSNKNIPQVVFQNLITACLCFGFILFMTSWTCYSLNLLSIIALVVSSRVSEIVTFAIEF